MVGAIFSLPKVESKFNPDPSSLSIKEWKQVINERHEQTYSKQLTSEDMSVLSSVFPNRSLNLIPEKLGWRWVC
jgi:hypothetical protein